MKLQLRARVLTSALVVAVVVLALVAPAIATAWSAIRDGSYVCQRFLGGNLLCYSGDHSTTFGRLSPYVMIGLATIGTVAVCWLLTGWAVRPLRAMRAAVDVMGPTNLGQRLGATGSGNDELRRLGDSIDALMERVAAGYEGQRRFAANASHELRTPLAVQRTLVEVAMAAPPGERDLDVLARQLIATNEQNVQLVEGLLVLSESDRGLADVASIRLDELASRVVKVHLEMAARHDVTLDAATEPATVLGDELLLERLVTNLVQNAIAYNVVGGRVDVRVGGRPVLTVTNTGEPVPAEAVPRLFEPFRRLASDRTHRGGAGLGLAIVRSVVLAHRGTVEARPGPAGGLVVDVDLPPVS